MIHYIKGRKVEKEKTKNMRLFNYREFLEKCILTLEDTAKLYTEKQKEMAREGILKTGDLLNEMASGIFEIDSILKG